MNHPYSLDYARLASGDFYETIALITFYEIINIFSISRLYFAHDDKKSAPISIRWIWFKNLTRWAVLPHFPAKISASPVSRIPYRRRP
jgi:hypothetical protein